MIDYVFLKKLDRWLDTKKPQGIAALVLAFVALIGIFRPINAPPITNNLEDKPLESRAEDILFDNNAQTIISKEEIETLHKKIEGEYLIDLKIVVSDADQNDGFNRKLSDWFVRYKKTIEVGNGIEIESLDEIETWISSGDFSFKITLEELDSFYRYFLSSTTIESYLFFDGVKILDSKDWEFALEQRKKFYALGINDKFDIMVANQK